ncbi:MAG: hypothetical protein ACI87E_000662 [Mariniblastus sp.]|jgi:hypothetical protein
MLNFLLLLCVLIVPQEPTVAQDLPAEIAKWESAIAQLELRDQAEGKIEDGILFYGSSSIRRWKTMATDMAPWATIQRGYGGAKLPDIIHYAPRVIGPRLGESNPQRCKALVLFVGNDIAGKPTDASPVQVGERFSQLHRWIRQKDPTVPVFWIEVTPTNSRWEQWAKVEQATKCIDKIINNDGNSFLISTAGAFLASDGRPRSDLFVKDQLHLNQAGYQQWAAIIKSQLYKRLVPLKPLTPTVNHAEKPVK